MAWINEVDSARNMDELKSSNSQTSRYLIPKNYECPQEVTDRGFQEASQHGENGFLKGRPIANMIHRHFRISGTCEALLDLEVQLKNGNVQGFDTKWDEVLVSMTKSSRKGDIEKVVQQTAPVRRGTEISCDTVSAGYSAEKRTGQLFWAERHGSPVCGAEISDNNFDARNEDRSLQVSAPRNRNPRGNPKGDAQKTIKDTKLRILCSTDLERTVFARRFVQLHFSKKKR